MIADGAYGGTENHKIAASKNVHLVTTKFQGRNPDEILGESEFNEDVKKVLKCTNGQVPITNKYNESNVVMS